ncbi:MAG: hypothetical protein U0175_35585 [Caldilineaceae bacterium]
MLRINRFFTILLLVALILSACQPIQPVVPGTGLSPNRCTGNDIATSSTTNPMLPPMAYLVRTVVQRFLNSRPHHVRSLLLSGIPPRSQRQQ